MGSVSGMGFYPFGTSGRIYGAFIRVRRRAYVIGATQRGIFWRFGARIFCPVEGYFESIFGIRTAVGLIELMLKVGMKDEIIPVRFRPNWIHGALHFQRSGGVSFVITAMDSNRFPKMQGENVGDFSTAALYGDNFYDKDGEERKQLDSY